MSTERWRTKCRKGLAVSRERTKRGAVGDRVTMVAANVSPERSGLSKFNLHWW